MKKLVVVVIVIALFAAVESSVAATNTLSVSASVSGTCRFNSATSTLAFGALDPSLSTDATATSSTTFWCTKDTTYSITNDGGLHNSSGPRMQHATIPAEFIPYTLTLSPLTGSGSGKATPVTLNISGTIVNANYINAAAGNYADTVVITVTP